MQTSASSVAHVQVFVLLRLSACSLTESQRFDKATKDFLVALLFFTIFAP
jgi:hypothetical protein